MSATYVGEYVTIGGGVRAFASAECVTLITFDQLGPWTRREVSREVLANGHDLGRYIAHAAHRRDELVILAGHAWRAHCEAAEAARTIDAEVWTEVAMPGASV